MGLPLSRLIVLCLAWGAVAVRAEQPYFPPPGDAWATRPPASVGVDPDKLAAAVKFAQSNEVAWPLDVRAQIEKDTAQEPYPEIIGPVKPRGGQNGIILRRGFIVAEWGDTKRVDVTFSVAKSYLSLMAGLAFDRGLIPDVHEPVGIRVKDGGFDSPHNSPITWHMLLTHTSEWEGVLWDKPDVADRRRGYDRTLQQPGTFWEYNDVRVNRLALSLLRVWQRPLPEVLKEVVMDPIGATSDWAWYGYFNSYVDLGGQRVQSVSGGTHWGGGIWASTRDHARFGYLWLRKGEWAGKRILSERWVDMATKPVDIAPFYGYLFWLPAASSPVFRDVPPRSYFALGSGGNMIYVDPDRDLVAVVRWLDIPKLGEFVKLVAAAVDGGSSR